MINPNNNPKGETMTTYTELENNKKIYTAHYPITTYHLDAKIELSIPYLCRFILDSAGSHAYKLGFSVPDMFKHNMTWVLSRFHVKIEKIPTWGDELIIKTWPSGTKGLFAFREFFLFDKNKNPIGEATSAWIILNVETRRPLRTDVVFKDDTYIYKKQTRKGMLDKLKLQELPENRTTSETLFTRDFRVRYTDLDLNQHVTSVSYIEWALDTLPIDIRTNYHLKELEINFLAEAHIEDTVETHAYSDANYQNTKEPPKSIKFNHQIYKKEANNKNKIEFAKAITMWHYI